MRLVQTIIAIQVVKGDVNCSEKKNVVFFDKIQFVLKKVKS